MDGGARPGRAGGRRSGSSSAEGGPQGLCVCRTSGHLKISLRRRPPTGMALMEEASIAAVNGELSPFTTGVTACQMISACRDLTDYRRASEWIEATEKYCAPTIALGLSGRMPDPSRRGGCRRWGMGERRARARAGDGRTQRIQRDGYPGGRRACTRSVTSVGSRATSRAPRQRSARLTRGAGVAQPALALVRLAEGKVKAAAGAINAAVDEQTGDRWARARLLPSPGRDRDRR